MVASMKSKELIDDVYGVGIKIGIDPIIKRSTNFDGVINNTMIYSSAIEKYNTHRHTLNNVRKNNLVSLGLPNDSDYSLYHTFQMNSNIGKLQSIEEAFENNDFLLADTVLQSFVDTNLIEMNLKFVFSMYVKIMKGETLSSTELSNLNTLAFADPIANGYAVVSAAVLLDLDIPWPTAVVRENESFNLNKYSDINVLIYPNPFHDKFYVSISSIDENKSYSVSVFNIMGKVILSKQVSAPLFEIDLTTYGNAVYFVEIKKSTNEIISYKRIVKE